MNKFLLGLILILSSAALGISGSSLFQVSQLQNLLRQQTKTVTQQQQQITSLQQEIAEFTTAVAESSTQEEPRNSVNPSNPTTISFQPGQLVRQGVDNRIKIELASVTRMQNPQNSLRDVVSVQIRLKRITPDKGFASINLNDAKARNPLTSEVYQTVTNQRTPLPHVGALSTDAWGNAYFWLQIPEGVETVDLVIPKTAIFNGVPIPG